MRAALQPMSLGEILDRTFAIYRSRFWTFVAIAALPTVVTISFLFGLTHWLLVYSTDLGPLGVLPACLAWLASSFVAAFLGLMAMPPFITLACAAVRDRPSSLKDSFRQTLECWRSYSWIAILKLLFTMIAPAAAVMVLLLAEVVIANLIGAPRTIAPREWIPAIGLPTLGGFCLFLWAGAGLSLAIPAAVIEGAQGYQGLRRSWLLTRASRFRILITWLSVFLSFWIGCIALQFLLGQTLYRLGSTLHLESAARNLYDAAAMPIYAGVSCLLVPIYPIATALFYYDQRTRREGFDVEQMMEGAEMSPSPSARATDVMSEDPSEPL